MKKRGQLLSHPFTVILTLVVAALILFFGISSIRDLLDVNSQVDIATLRNTLQKEVNTYYTLDEGSRKSISIRVPRQVAYICFVDQSSEIDYSLIPNKKENLVRTINDKNTFLISELNKPSINPLNIEHLKPAINPLCIKTSNNLIANIINKGQYVEISK